MTNFNFLHPEHLTTKYLGAVIVADGYNGHTVLLHLCKEPFGNVLAVHSMGYFTWLSS